MARRYAPDVTIIEVLDPDDPSLLWSDAPIGTVPEPPRRPPTTPQRRGAWPWLFGTAAVLAVAWFVASALGDDPEPPEPPVVLAAGRYLLDDPTLTAYSADIVSSPVQQRAFRMWADKARPGGRQVQVEAVRGVAPPFVATDAVVHVVGDVTLMASRADPDVVVAERELNDGWHAIVTMRGLDLDEAATVAQDVQVVTLAERYEIDLLRTQFGSLDLRPVAADESLDTGLYGDVTTELHYLDEAGVEYTLRVAEGAVDDAARLLPFLADSLPSTVGGRVVGRLERSREGVVLWEDGGHLLSLTAPIDPSTLVSSADRVRQATSDEWQTLLRGLLPDYRLGEASVMAEPPGEGWIAGAQRAQRGDQELLLWWFSEPGDRSSVVSRPASPLDPSGLTVDRFVIDGHTFVFVRLEPTGGDAVRVSWGRNADVRLELRPAYLDDTTLMGVFRVDAPGDIEVEVIPRGFAGP
ncbi:MAG: hypothetical protein RL238_378 [Actinomycetota bacterium]|jgi:hypothetical protein